MEKLAEVSDQEIRIDFALHCKCRANVTLKSLNATTPLAFKVQTSSPHKFLVNPPSGLVPPLSSTTFQVILKPQSQLPHTFPRYPPDRFLIKTTLAPPDFSHNSPEFINSLFNSVPHRPTYDIKLKVAYVGRFLLSHAVSIGDCECVRKLMKRQRSVVAELETREAESLFRVATQLDNNSDEMVHLLLEAGLRVVDNARVGLDDVRWASKGWTELHVAVAFDRTDEVERLVRERKCGPLDYGDREGRTPLHLAASKGHLGCAKMLVSAGVNVDARSKDGRTALYRAAANGDRRIVELLIEAGADPTITEVDLGRSAVDIARDKRHNEIVKILERGEAVVGAARRGEVELLESLLEKGASMNFFDQYGLTALHIAAIKGHKDVIMLLAEYGANLDCQDSEGHTPLHLAVEGGCIETVEVLINRGANINVKSKRGATPLQISRILQLEDISQLLVDYGATCLELSTSSSSSLL